MQNAQISILMPVRNAVPYLSDCLHSILQQEDKNWELIAVNDHSEDASLEVLQHLATQDSRIRVLENNGHGIIAALRTAYSQAKAPLIHRMDADDIMPKTKLSTLKSLWEPGAVVTGKVKYFSDDWLVGLGFQNYEAWLNQLMEEDAHWRDIYMECPIPSPAWLISAEDLDSVGAFDSDLIPEDYDFAFRLYRHGLKLVSSQEVVHLWRDSQQRTSRMNPEYFPMAYYPLKVHHFLRIDRDDQKELYLWGAGKKGKRVAQLLLESGTNFQWITDNPKKQGIDIYGKTLQAVDLGSLKGNQTICAVSSPEDKVEMKERLEQNHQRAGEDHWWFC